MKATRKTAETDGSMRIIQITDTHMSAEPELQPRRVRDLARTIDAILALPAEEQPDVVLHTGDAANWGQPEEYALVRKEMERLSCPWFITPGNRDSRRRMREAFGDLGWLPEGEGPLDFAVSAGPLRLVGFDSKGPKTNKGWADEKRLAALRRMLEEADGTPVVLFLHHSPYVVDEIPDPYQFAEWEHAEALNDLVSDFPNVQVVLTGHVHRHVRGTVGYAPAVTMLCVASDLRKGPAKALADTPAWMAVDFDDAGHLLKAAMETAAPAVAGAAAE